MGSDVGVAPEPVATCCHARSNYCIGQSELKGEVREELTLRQIRPKIRGGKL